MKILLSFIVFFAIASVCYAGRIASISQVQDNQCVDVDLDTYYFCSPCTVNGETFYYSLFESDFLFYSDKFNDSNCYYYLERNVVHEDKSCAPASHNLCEFYVKTTEFTYFELDISSSTPINATFFAQKFESTITQTSLVARGDQIEGLIVQNEDHFFRYEKRVSPTKYSSTLGVFSYGEVYSQNNFKFSVSLVVLPGNPSQHISPVLVVFYPFSTISVTEEDAEYHFLTTSHGGEFIVSTDQTYSLTGLSLTNYLYGVQNMTLFPEFELNNEYYNGNIVVQVDESPFITFPCYLSTSTIRGNSVDIYDCHFESYSFSYGGSWGSWGGSFSFDEHGLQKDREHRPDQMAFSLF